MSWYSNIASRVNSSVSNLQRTVFNSETDGDTQDDTYVCRVLRQYYTNEKGTGLPAWLPPDPKAPPPAPVVVAGNTAQQQAMGRYGAANGVPASASAGGLSSLWDKNRAAGGGGASVPPAVNARNPFAQRGSDPGAAAALQPGRPQPGQRAGSYQPGGTGAGTPVPGSVQDRLRSKLGSGARTVSPGTASGPFSPPPPAAGGGGGGGGDYDPYRAGSYGGGGGGAPSGGAAPGGRYGGGGGGLPSGPRRMGGLPSGPRMR